MCEKQKKIVFQFRECIFKRTKDALDEKGTMLSQEFHFGNGTSYEPKHFFDERGNELELTETHFPYTYAPGKVLGRWIGLNETDKFLGW